MCNDSQLYIIDGILDYSKNKKLLAAIDLALFTIFQGKERTLKSITQLLKTAHLEIIKIHTINDLMCAIQCKKRLS